jgi:preprotein translocase subunit YajC
MNNFKKFVAVLLGVVMACVFATSAFADTASDKALIKSKMSAYGLSGFESVIDGLSDSGVAVLMTNKDTLIAQANQVQAYLNDNHPAADQAANVQNALNSVNSILTSAGINATVNVSVSGDTVTVTATANGASKTIAKTVDPSKETNKSTTDTSAAVKTAAKNSVVASNANANPIAASSSAVIKATGDNTAVVFAAAALAVAGILGMAVRKERAL